MKKLALVLLESRDTRYSIRAIAAAVEHRSTGIHLFIEKLDNINENIQLVQNLIEKDYRVLLGITLMTTMLPELLRGKFFEKLQLLRRSSKGKLLLIAGGPHPSGDPYGTLTSLGFDIAFIGESEDSLNEVIDTLKQKWSLESLLDIKGLAIKLDNRICFTGRRRKFVDLNAYPPFPYWRRLFSPIEITRGCPWLCKYCETWFMHGVCERHRRVDVILRYVKILLEHGLRDIRFISPNSFGYGELRPGKPNIEALQELVEGLYKLTRRYGGRFFLGSFPSEVRPEYVVEETLEIVKGKIANKNLIIGAQTGSEKLLRYIHRTHTVDDIVNAAQLAIKYGYKPDIDFIFGLPGEDVEDILETIKLIEKLISIGARIHAHTFLPLPGTPFENAPPGRIHPLVLKLLGKYLGAGKVHGYWFRQEKLAKELYMLRKNGVIWGLQGWKLMEFSC